MLHPTPLHSPHQNHLLAALPLAAFEPLMASLELVPMPLGEMLYEPGLHMRHAYFPTTVVVSLHYVTATGASVETSGVGHEGVVGISLFMGGDSTTSSAVVQTAGHGYRLERGLMLSEFDRADALQRSLLRYTLALIAQISQSATGYIRYRRGHISVLNREGLQTRACECYGVVKRELHRPQPR